jgi:hypothetical protein
LFFLAFQDKNRWLQCAKWNTGGRFKGFKCTPKSFLANSFLLCYGKAVAVRDEGEVVSSQR